MSRDLKGAGVPCERGPSAHLAVSRGGDVSAGAPAGPAERRRLPRAPSQQDAGQRAEPVRVAVPPGRGLRFSAAFPGRSAAPLPGAACAGLTLPPRRSVRVARPPSHRAQRSEPRAARVPGVASRACEFMVFSWEKRRRPGCPLRPGPAASPAHTRTCGSPGPTARPRGPLVGLYGMAAAYGGHVLLAGGGSAGFAPRPPVWGC